MSGIFGAIEDLPNLIEKVAAGAQSLSHRGPDGSGSWVSQFGRVALSQCQLRLNRLDPSGPVASRSGKTVIALDGEIHNRRGLSLEFPELNLPAEVNSGQLLTEMLELFGIGKTLQHIKGSFSFACVSESDRNLILATDPTGSKPIYVYEDLHSFCFASEIKAFFTRSDFDFSIDEERIKEVLVFGEALVEPDSLEKTLYRKIWRLPPGHFFCVDVVDFKKNLQKYWDLPVLGPSDTRSLQTLGSELRELIRQSVGQRLGELSLVGLSGGNNSFLLANLAREVLGQSGEKLRTFSLEWNSISSELNRANFFANALKSDHNLIYSDLRSISADSIIRHFDEPISEARAIFFSLLFREASRFSKKLLVACGVELLQAPRERFSIFKRRHEPSLFQMKSLFSESEYEKFFKEKCEEQIQAAKKLDIHWQGLEPIIKFRYFHFKKTLSRLQTSLDRMGMLNGIEVQAPFLDKDLLELLFLVPRLDKLASELDLDFKSAPLSTNFRAFKLSKDFEHLKPWVKDGTKERISSETFTSDKGLHFFSVENFLAKNYTFVKSQEDEKVLKSNLQSLFDDSFGSSKDL